MGLSRIMKLTPGATASTSARHILLELPGVTEITVDPRSGALYEQQKKGIRYASSPKVESSLK